MAETSYQGDHRAPTTATQEFAARPLPTESMANLTALAEEVGGAYKPRPGAEGAVAFTHFDTPSSEDNAITILLTKENMNRLPSQTLVRIESVNDDGKPDRTYLGTVVAGPFAEPDGFRTDSSLIITTTVEGSIFLPRYHGRASVQILGEERDGQLIPPRYRPKPNSPVFPLDAADTARVLKVGGDARLGLVVGQEEIVVGIPTDKKSVLPRHLGIIGTTGSGKSTTVAGLVRQLQRAGVATIVIDVEGEYTEMDLSTEDTTMRTALSQRGLVPAGIDHLHIYHLVGRDTSREAPGAVVKPFCLLFSSLSPYAVMEILDLSPAQQERFLKAYDTLKLILRDLEIFPRKGEEGLALEVDELERGYPRMTLLQLIDVARVFADMAAATRDERSKSKGGEADLPAATFELFSPELRGQERLIRQRTAAAQAPGNVVSWRGLLGKLWRVQRLQIFDNPDAPRLNHASLVQPRGVSVIDLSDTDSPAVNNLVIADLLRGVQRQQEANFRKAQATGERPTPVVIIVEEAHEFLSAQRIHQMPVLFQQVARIAKRGRKRWLGLVFVTQLPQHLPDEVLGLINNFILHKIADGGVVERLRRSIGGLDKGQWAMIPGLAPGQALVSLTHMARPLLVSIDPAPCKLKLME
ncbi:MAG TPA: ATP-binding protein [Alphaproteobacteria bacterium]|nr:ATP-binding protein [Alphaproteobacteria bacterium]